MASCRGGLLRGKGQERIAVCEGCGVEFPVKNRRSGPTLCPRCRNQQYKRARKERLRRNSSQSNQAIAGVAAQAREAHMSYGQYVAERNGG